jgi:hypothetical protein
MSLTGKTDVKNPSARHRTQIHLAPSASRQNAAHIPQQESTAADPKVSGSLHTPLLVSAPNVAEASPIVLSKTPQGTSE